MTRADEPTTTEKGRVGERRAVSELQARGYRVVEQNVRAGRYEIDIVAWDGELLCFVEVRRRKHINDALWSVTGKKQHRVARAAAAYLTRFKVAPRCRFDVVVLTNEEVRVLQGAFEAVR